MEALNATRLTPISVLFERRTEPRKNSSLPAGSPFKHSNSVSLSSNLRQTLTQCLSRSFHGGLVLMSSVLGSGQAKALTFDEALRQFTSFPTFDFDPSGVLDSIVGFGTENTTIVAGGVAVLAVPLVLYQIFKQSKPWGTESARKAYAVLGEEASAQLLDIRAPVEFRQVGSPNIRGLGKKPVSIVYKSSDKPGFLKKLSLKFKEPEKTTLFVLDKFDGNSELVAELATVNGFKAAYAIKDGAEGPRGWMNSGLPWIPPSKALSFDVSNLTETISEALGESSGGLPLTVGIAAVTGLGVLAFSEIETILQLLGSAAIIQFVSKKLLFAEDRKQTLQQVDEFLSTKVAPKELADEIMDIGKAFLPPTRSSNALPPPTPTTANNPAEFPPQINSVPPTKVEAEPLSGFSRPLSPYPYYPDFKPPTSPTPSQP